MNEDDPIVCEKFERPTGPPEVPIARSFSSASPTMAHPIRLLPTKTSEAVSSLSIISDFRLALEVLVMNALESNANSLRVTCNLSSSSLSVCDNGSGFGLNALLKLGNGPVTTKQNPNNRGLGLFGLSRVSKISIVSRSPLTGLFKEKTISFGDNMELKDVKELENGETTRVTATELFANCPVRQRFLASSFASQHRSIIQFVTQIAAFNHLVHFSFSIDGDPPFVLPPEDKFDRLRSLFADAFSLDFDWIPVDFKSTELCIHGIIISPYSFHSVPSRSNAARLLFCRERCVSSPEITSTIDTTWLSFFVEKEVNRSNKHYPTYFLEATGPQDAIELFRGIDISTLLLHHTAFPAAIKNLREYLHLLFTKHALKPETEHRETAPEFSAETTVSAVSQLHCMESNDHQSEYSMTTSEIWKSVARTEVLQHRSRMEILPCRLPRLSVPNPHNLLGIRVIGQVDSKFIVGVSRDGVLCAFDQHAVHERLRFEFLLRLLRTKSPTVLDSSEVHPPIVITLSFSQYTNIQYVEKELRSWKWRFEVEMDIQENPAWPILVITHVPVVASRKMNPEQILIHTAELIANKGSSLTPSMFLSAIKSKACRGAIMFGDALSVSEMESMVHELSKCTQPFACAHGRTSIALLTDV